MSTNQDKKHIDLKWVALGFGIILLSCLLVVRWEDNKELVLSIGMFLISPFEFPITTIPFIVLLIIFALSVTGILRSDKNDEARLFYSSVLIFILSLAGLIFLCYLSIIFGFMTD